jgi:alkylhydroperoxidase/carboxymuconolactone decarboxylase family protein YurZ
MSAPLLEILTTDEIALLRGGYDPAVLNAGTRAALVTATCPEAGGLIDPLLKLYFPEKRARNTFFDKKVRSAARRACPAPAPLELDNAAREIVLLTILARQGNAQFLAIHVYWALMEGLSVEAIVNVVLLTSYYEGVPVWSWGSGTLSKTLQVLKAQAAGKVDTMSVIGAIKSQLPG